MMSHRAILEDILRLPVEERLQLVEEAWQSLAATPESVPVPEWHRRLLDERLANPDERATITLGEVNDHALLRSRGSSAHEV